LLGQISSTIFLFFSFEMKVWNFLFNIYRNSHLFALHLKEDFGIGLLSNAGAVKTLELLGWTE
jgi:hypothetical protein